ncbi:MAG: peptide chain release factor N(5)-glutamine methyltransferase [Proteobacteria bacterium]|nr:peptide chain release factor N(5)-glutamine methyltransferase [Pseudomonadota bacterium]MBU1714556.1 peptide chain release factor N(5)-glutamine methyltransferase [Pseudomonadota bacterium]
MIVKELYASAVNRLQEAGIPDAGLEVDFMLECLLSFNRAQLITSGEQAVSPEVIEILEAFLARRLAREPLAYILGEQEFWSLPFYVTSDVLIPRPETEYLIETVLQNIGRADNYQGQVLELGTGSGIIAVILALELPAAKVFSVDFSRAALVIARSNVYRHRVEERVRLINASWLDSFSPEAKFDLIVSNPPYVGLREKNGLQPELSFEPELALFGGERGEEILLELAPRFKDALKPGGMIFLEIGADQGDYVLDIFRSLHDYDKLHVYSDYSGHPRVFQARLKSL